MSEGRAPIQCPECGTENPAGTKFCESCGVRLVEVATPTKKRRRDPDKAARFEIERKLTRARRLLRSIRNIYVVLAIGFAIWTAIMFLVKAPTAVLVIMTTQTVCLIAGSIFLYAQPLFFTLGLACLLTVAAAIEYYIGGLTVSCVIDGFFAFAAWCAVSPIAGVTKLMKEYPALIDDSKLRRRKRHDAPTSEALARAETRRADQRRAKMRTAGIVAGVIVGVIGIVIAVNALGGDPEVSADTGNTEKAWTASELRTMENQLQPAIDAFVAAWGRSDVEWIGNRFEAGRQISFWPKVLRLLDRRGFMDDLPEIEPQPNVTELGPDKHDVVFEFSIKGQLKTRWVWDEGDWRLYKLTLSKMR